MRLVAALLLVLLGQHTASAGRLGASGSRSALSRRTLIRKDTLSIERNYVDASTAQELYEEVMEASMPGPYDDFHESLLGINGDAGEKLSFTDSMERVRKFQSILNSPLQDQRESGILRIEHLKQVDYEQAKKLINKVVENKVLEEDGTIHVYVSRPEASALANHTDITDIFVLQLHGSKEWLFCEDTATFYEEPNDVQKKLDKCTTYNDVEIESLVCHREVLYPGDALFLPKRIVHSARATNDGISAHLTFGFADNTCSMDLFGGSGESNEQRTLAMEICNSDEGGSQCDTSCNQSCDECNCSCDMGASASCDGCCNSSCDSSCNSGCNSGCPPTTAAPSSSAAPSSFGIPDEFLSDKNGKWELDDNGNWVFVKRSKTSVSFPISYVGAGVLVYLILGALATYFIYRRRVIERKNKEAEETERAEDKQTGELQSAEELRSRDSDKRKEEDRRGKHKKDRKEKKRDRKEKKRSSRDKRSRSRGKRSRSRDKRSSRD